MLSRMDETSKLYLISKDYEHVSTRSLYQLEMQNCLIYEKPIKVLDGIFHFLQETSSLYTIPPLKIKKQLLLSQTLKGCLTVKGIDENKDQDFLIKHLKINDEETDTIDLSGLDYKDILKIKVQFDD